MFVRSKVASLLRSWAYYAEDENSALGQIKLNKQFIGRSLRTEITCKNSTIALSLSMITHDH